MKWNGKSRLAVQNTRGQLVLAASICLLLIASVVVWYVRMRKHCKERRSTAPHAVLDTARHSTALRDTVELAKLNRASTLLCVFLCFSYYPRTLTTVTNILLDELLVTNRLAYTVRMFVQRKNCVIIHYITSTFVWKEITLIVRPQNNIGTAES